jgi:hypothetical protein
MALCLAACCCGWAGRPAQAETWTDASGKFRVEAKFLGIKNQDVYLKKDSDGATIKVPLSKLSAESQKQARELAGGGTPGEAAGDTPDAAARAVVAALEAGDLRAVWDALPPSYQKDVNGLVHTFAANMDPDIWKGGADIVKKAQQVLEQKKEFILAYPAVASHADKLTPNYDKIVDVLKAVVSSELSDLSKLKTIDVGKFLDGSGKKIVAKLTALAKEADQAGLSKDDFPALPVPDVPDLNKTKFTTVSVDGDTAKIRIEVEGKDPEEHEAVRVEGKWLPKQMVDGWADGIAAGTAKLKEMGPEMKKNKQQAAGFFLMANGVLGALLGAKTQEEFDQAIDTLMNLAGGGPGGPGEKTSPGPGGDDPFGPPKPSTR